MIKLIVGLGNPGSQYEKTRHNVGFLFLDRLQSNCSGSWANEARFHGLVASCIISGQKVLLLKPQTFMNRSGLSVGALARYYKIDAEEILVVHDELDLPVGACRLKKAGGHAGHNGLRDIISVLSENGFYRLRLGIGRPDSGKKVADYVLSAVPKQDAGSVAEVFDLLGEQIASVVLGEMSLAMGNINKKTN